MEKLERANSYLSKAHELMKDQHSGRLSREDRAVLWERWQEAKEAILHARSQFFASIYAEMKHQAADALQTAAYGEPKEAKEKVKLVQQLMKQHPMTKEQRIDVTATLDNAWQRAIERLGDKHKEWRERQHGYLERCRVQLEKQEAYVDKLEEEIAGFERERGETTRERRRETLQVFIDQRHEALRKVQSEIEALKDKIRDVEGKM